MNTRNLITAGLLLIMIIISGCGLRTYRAPLKLPGVNGGNTIQVTPSIELLTKTYIDGSFEKGSYSLFNLSQDKNINKGVVDIEFLDIDGTNPIINTQINLDQMGRIVDLGLTSCKSYPNKNEQTGNYPGVGHSGYPYVEDRTMDPLFWLQYSDMYAQLKDQANGPTAKVVTGHCYILQRTNSNYQILAAFHVKEYIKARSIKLDDIEVFSKLVFQH
jgi:hypothetical protein